ncbi:endophilin-B1-like [Paramacrobiotus metropolitanus]|uniref:endophilin-B1-like n=1 Tax=Paramacrobiotus metropolitanus TaxID=2943436 RepID=UPI0024461E02|nr:endophilin-B1-like [Paramacrobiotus metropolitanus]XP_055335163.1 endophilin-B1-like [Paramacrobiotus metropolitanus]XP_055335164.1 endophilin-B1-like [Paramacrobiotus metropolitanus]
MDFKKILNRAVQFAEEKVGREVEKTRLEADMEHLIDLQDKVKNNTEKIVRTTETVLQPNPNIRMEEYVYEKLDKRLRQRTTPLSEMGQALIEAGNDFGAQGPYGSALIKVGTYQNRLGQAELDFVSNSAEVFLTPLRRFLEGDIKTVMKERKELNNKRLDLDAAKSKLKKTNKDDPKTYEITARIENEARLANSEFERQAEITRLLLEGVASCQGNHLRYLKDFAEAQMKYYAMCKSIAEELHHELSSVNPTDCQPPTYNSMPPVGARKARVLCDYESGNSQELTLHAGDIIFITSVASQDGDWLLAQRPTGEKGKVPATYIEFLE